MEIGIDEAGVVVEFEFEFVVAGDWPKGGWSEMVNPGGEPEVCNRVPRRSILTEVWVRNLGVQESRSR